MIECVNIIARGKQREGVVITPRQRRLLDKISTQRFINFHIDGDIEA